MTDHTLHYLPEADEYTDPPAGFIRLAPGVFVDIRKPHYEPPEIELPERATDALPDLWKFAKLVWRELRDVFGRPAALWLLEWMPVREHRLLKDWLLHLEGFVRRLIFIAAFNLNLPVAASAAVPLRTSRTTARFLRPETEDPRTWRVSFPFMPRATSPGQERYAPSGIRRTLRPVRDYARRLEALARAIVRRDAHAKRFARRLARFLNPPALDLKPWDYHPSRRTSGKRGVQEGMHLADPLYGSERDRWRARYWEPG